MRIWILGAVAGGALAIGLAVLPWAARAADVWPSRPITIVVPFGAGSGTDIATRIIAQPLSAALGQNIVVDDRPGANGGIAATYVAKAAPDGYTLLMSTNSPHSSNPALLKNIAYDPVKDFAPITRTGSFTLMLVVHPSVPAKSLAELIAYARANPASLPTRAAIPRAFWPARLSSTGPASTCSTSPTRACRPRSTMSSPAGWPWRSET